MTTIRFHCHSCQEYLQIAADRAGRRVRCGRCQAVLTVPAESEEELEVASPVAGPRPVFPEPEFPRRRPPRGEDDRDGDHEPPRRYWSSADSDRRRPYREHADDERYRRVDLVNDWGMLQAGMVSHIVSGWMMIAAAGLVAVGLLLLAIAVLTSPDRGGSEGLIKASVPIASIGLFVFCFLQIPSILGHSLSLAAPNRADGTALAVTTLCFSVGSLVLKIIFILIPAIRLMGHVLNPVPGLGNEPKPLAFFWFIPVWLGIAVEYVFFSLYLRSTGVTLESRKVVSGAIRGLIVSLVVIAMGVAASIVLGVTIPQRQELSPADLSQAFRRLLILGITSAIGIGVLLCQGLVLVHGASRARAAATEPRPPADTADAW